MKILVVSLLRLGDVILASSVPAGLKKKYPGCEVHMLINGQFSGVTKLISSVDKFQYFDREPIQKGLGDSSTSLFESFDRVKKLTKSLRSEEYDLVINLTHNRLSGWICSLVQAKDVIGLSFSSTGQSSFGSPWIRYLNNQMSSTSSEPFHYVDLFYYASGLDKEARSLSLQEDSESSEYAQALTAGARDIILIQPLTSDQKKNWPLKHFASVIESLQTLRPSAKFLILSSPAEAESIKPWVAEMTELGLRVENIVCDLSEAYSLLKRASLLVTGDTSIKHLASAAKTKVVEISIGSSYFQKTGIYQEGCIIVQSKEPCAPCPHKSPCSRQTHACGESLSPELITLVAGKLLDNHLNDLRLVVREFENEAEVYQTDFTESGYWSYHSLTPNNGEGSLARLLDLSSWKLFLQKELEKPMGEFGTESLRLRRTFKGAFPEIGVEEWSDLLTNLESRLERFESRLNVFMLDFKEFLKTYEQANVFTEYCRRLTNYVEKSDGEPVLNSYLVELQSVLSEISGSDMGDFVKIRRLNDSLIQSHQRIEVELKLVKSLRTNLMEKI
jgi:ADP-heptose:LPS heptosyltransferase